MTVTQPMHCEFDPPILAQLMRWCFQRKPGREARIRRAQFLFRDYREVLGRHVPIITVAGTSGKGTTCAMLESILLADGHVTGVCVKPHLLAFRERFRIAGRPISNAELAEQAESTFATLRQLAREHGPDFHPSLYESLLLMAASLFRKQGVTIALIEASVGGANDASSQLPADLSVVTSVDLDHQQELGDTLAEIAIDKAGIAQPGTTLVLGAALSPDSRSLMISECAGRNVECVHAEADDFLIVSQSVSGQIIRTPADHRVSLPLPGSHQVLNLATVWTIAKLMVKRGYLSDLNVISQVERAFLPGRFEYVAGSPSWLLDVAHNPASINLLFATVSQFFSADQVVAILGATEAHAYQTFVKTFFDEGLPVGFCEGFPKAVPVASLAGTVATSEQVFGNFQTPSEAIEFCLADKEFSDKTILVTGSLFLVGLCRHELSLRHITLREEA